MKRRVTAEPVTPHTPRPVRRPLLVQRWLDLAFAHWATTPETVQHLLPEGTRADTLDGVTFIGLIGFRMAGTGLLSAPGLPYLGTFCETNVRLYSVDDEGRRGVTFLSLDAAHMLPALIGRASLRLPYRWSSMRLDRAGDRYTYTCRRHRITGRSHPGVRSRMVIQAGEPIAEPTAMEHFLTARWGLHVRAHGRTLYLPGDHPRWPLHRAWLRDLDDGLVAAAGLPAPGGPPVSVLYSPGVAVRFGRPLVLR